MEDDSHSRGGQGQGPGTSSKQSLSVDEIQSPAGNNRPRKGEVSKQLTGEGRTAGSKDSNGWFGSLAGDHVTHVGFSRVFQNGYILLI